MSYKIIDIPEHGQEVVRLDGAESIVLDFNIAQAFFARAGNDLSISFENGSEVNIADFFVASGPTAVKLPELVMEDGTSIDAEEFLLAFDPDMDVSPAASAVSAGSGSGEYSDDAGELLGGVDALGSLGAVHWSSDAVSPKDEFSTAALADAGSVTEPGGGGGEVTPPGPDPDPDPGPDPESSYTARAVVYNPDGQTGAVRFYLVDENGERVLITDASQLSGYTLSSENDLVDVDWANVTIHPDGSISLPLSDAYDEQILANGGTPGGLGNLGDYITVSHNGHDYNMQVVINHDGNYKPQDAEDLRPSGETDLEEWHSSLSESVDSGKSSAGGNDAMWFESNFTGSEADLGDGNNSINIKGNIQGSGTTSIVSGSGNDTVNIDGSVTVTSGNTTINTGTGSGDTISIGKGLVATGSSSVADVLVVDGAVNIGGSVFGLKAEDSASIKVTGEEVNISADSSSAYAMGALSSGKNSVNAKDLTLETKAGNSGDAMYAEANGSNEVNAETLSIIGKSSINATTQGSNSVTVTGGAITLGDSVNKGWLLASQQGENTLHAANAESNTVTITGAVRSTEGGRNYIKTSGVTGEDEVSIGLTGSTGDAISTKDTGLTSIVLGEGNNTLNVHGSVATSKLSSSSSSGQAITEIAGGSGVDAVNVYGNLGVSGVDAYNIINTGDGADSLNVTGDIKANYGGTNEITMGGGDDSIVASNIYAGSDSRNIINMGDGNDIINAPGSLHGGFYSTGKNSHTTVTKGDGLLTINSGAVAASGSGSEFNIQVEDGKKADVTINSYLHASSGGSININENIGDLTINNEAKDRQFIVYAQNGGQNNLGADSININGSNTANTYGVYAASGSQNTLEVKDALNINLTTAGRGSVSPLQTHGLSVNNAGSKAEGKNTVIAAEDAKVTINIEAEYGENEGGVAGMYIKNESPAFAASNSITANDVDINVHAKSANAYGMYAFTGGNKPVSNIIEATDGHALTVVLKVATDGNPLIYKAVAMHAQGIGSENSIIGHSTSDTSDSINITGNIYASRGGNYITTGDGSDRVTIDGNLTVNSGQDGINGDGLNQISTGAGDDVVSITGDITVLGGTTVNGKGLNLIDTGDGNDMVYLDGKISSATALKLDMGDGYDTLVLTATNYNDFIAKYGKWIEAGGLKGVGIEEIHVNGVDVAEGTDLYNYLQSHVDTNTNLSSSVGDTLYLGSADIDGIGLSDVLDLREDINVLNFKGGKDNTLTIDDSMLSSVNGLTITGDGNDKVNLAGQWDKGDIDANGLVTYTHSDTGTTVQIQNGLVDDGGQSSLLAYQLATMNG